MPRDLKKIAFIIEECAVPSPAQQLLDRFLIGYPRDGKFQHLEGCQIAAHLTQGDDTELRRRSTDFGLSISPTIESAVADADAVVVAWRGAGAVANDSILSAVLNAARPRTACFVHGALAGGLDKARALTELATSRNIILSAGTPLGVTWRLPEIKLPKNVALKEALVVVQGPTPDALFEGLDCLLPLIELRKGGESGVREIRAMPGGAVWRSGDNDYWSWSLLAAALSRSDSPQGDPVKDGRTQDLVGLDLVQKLAPRPRGWEIKHRDGLRTTVLSLDGVVADYNMAVRTSAGVQYSTQIYRAPLPAQHHYSRLAEVLENFFRGGAIWPTGRGPFIAGLLEAFNRLPEGQLSDPPGLTSGYRV